MRFPADISKYLEVRTPKILAMLTTSEIEDLSNLLLPTLRHSEMPAALKYDTRCLSLQGCIHELATIEHEVRCEIRPEKLFERLKQGILRDRKMQVLTGGRGAAETLHLRAANDGDEPGSMQVYSRAIAMKNQLTAPEKQEVLLHMGYSKAMAEVSAPDIDREALAAEMRADPSDAKRTQMRGRALLGHQPDLSGMSALFDLLRKVAACEPAEPFTNDQIVATAKDIWSREQALAQQQR